MTLDEIIVKRTELEKQLHVLLSIFEDDTGVNVTTVDISRCETTSVTSARVTSRLTRVSLACEVP